MTNCGAYLLPETATRPEMLRRWVPPARSARPRSAMAQWGAVVGCGVLLATASGAAAQDVWESTPCRIKVVIAAADGSQLAPYRRQSLAAGLVARTDSLIGAAWQLSCIDAPAGLRTALLDAPRSLTFAELQQLAADCDELALVSIVPASGGYRVRVFPWDVTTQQPSEQIEGWVARTALTDGIFRFLVESFSPLARIEPIDLQTVRLRFRGSELPQRSLPILRVAPADIFRAVLRTNQRDGQAKSIRLVEWTYLTVTKVEQHRAICRVRSGLRNPLGGRRRGRTDSYAVMLRCLPGTTRLVLGSRSDPARNLVGYDVYAYGPDSKATTHLGRTDSAGGIDVPAGPQRLRLLLVKHGGELLARLPIVPGEAPELMALVPDDDRRLQAEGLIVGLQENLVDLVVRRALLTAQARNYIQEDKLDEAGQSIAELRRLRTQQQFLLQLEQERQRLASADPVVQRKIDKLFDDTTKLLGMYLMPQELETLEAEWNRARTKAGRAPAAMNSADTAAEAKAKSAPDATGNP